MKYRRARTLTPYARTNTTTDNLTEFHEVAATGRAVDVDGRRRNGFESVSRRFYVISQVEIGHFFNGQKACQRSRLDERA